MLGVGTSKHCRHAYRAVPLSSAIIRAQGTPLNPPLPGPHAWCPLCAPHKTWGRLTGLSSPLDPVPRRPGISFLPTPEAQGRICGVEINLNFFIFKFF